jgi:hypothetical protein
MANATQRSLPRAQMRRALRTTFSPMNEDIKERCNHRSMAYIKDLKNAPNFERNTLQRIIMQNTNNIAQNALICVSCHHVRARSTSTTSSR